MFNSTLFSIEISYDRILYNINYWYALTVSVYDLMTM